MAITFYIPGPLRQHTGGRHKVEIEVCGLTVGGALEALWRAYPGLRDRILTEQGEVRQHVNVFVGEENIRYCGGLAATVIDGGCITLVPAVSGGATVEPAPRISPPWTIWRPHQGPEGRSVARHLSRAFDLKAKSFVKGQVSFMKAFDVAGKLFQVRPRHNRLESVLGPRAPTLRL